MTWLVERDDEGIIVRMRWTELDKPKREGWSCFHGWVPAWSWFRDPDAKGRVCIACGKHETAPESDDAKGAAE